MDAKEGGASSKEKDKEEKKDEEVLESEKKKAKPRGRPRKPEGGSASANANAKAPALFCVGDRVLLKSYIEGDDENLEGYFITTITQLTQKESGEVLYCLRKVDGTVSDDVQEALLVKSVQM